MRLFLDESFDIALSEKNSLSRTNQNADALFLAYFHSPVNLTLKG